MSGKFAKNITPFIESELALASEAKAVGSINVEFKHLENAHVLGQESTYWHVRVHVLMLIWAFRSSRPKEFFGQLFRIIGAATKTGQPQ